MVATRAYSSYHGGSVGLGSDFDGMDTTTNGIEDVSDFPALVCSHSPIFSTNLVFIFAPTDFGNFRHNVQIAELYSRGWNADELGGLASGNFLRVFAAAEDVAREMAREGITPAQDLFEKRVDISWK